MYADYRYYTEGYLLGKSPAVPEEIFPYWEKQARNQIEQYTFGRISADSDLISEKVKDCTCELAEFLYQADSVSQHGIQDGAAGPISSYSNDGESASFDLSRSVYTEDGKSKKVKEIIYRYLSNTGLLYAGVR